MNRPMRDPELSETDRAASPITMDLQAARSRRERPWLRYVVALAVVAMLFGGAAYWLFSGDDVPPPRQVREIVVTIVPPPPPPPPLPPPPPEQKMIETKPTEQEFKDEKPIEKPEEKPATEDNNKADLPPDASTLDAPVAPNGVLAKGVGRDGGGGGGGGSRFGSYASMVVAQVQAALGADKRTRYAAVRTVIRVWADATGRVTKVTLSPSTGDAQLDSVICNDVIGRMILREPPPRDAPMPMVARVTENRPG